MDDDTNSDNSCRLELMWSTRSEAVIENWGARCLDSSTKHGKKGRQFKVLHHIFGLSAILVPIFTSSYIEYLPLIALATLIVIGGVLSGIVQFLDFATKSARHLEYENRYAERCNKIEAEMCKPSARRVACDVYLEHTLSNFNRLCAGAPDL